ncbi:hypothetical protein C4D60_Mb10t10550 [Musa balbisiana]|uniref:DUF3741 domain-containing protein n=1 Tax=Musa balbisiana TaxID=52838 RepID=A0A4S8IWY3_MUSBA|nr:hypothetical protein C4D60_Mb10t10550 [Musa balbisiana]
MSLAIVDKKPQQQRRPGGFVAIFFRLLDWNRRLAKKNLSSRKPLPPVRAAKGSAKRFGADDKMPLAKLLLVDDDNGGCFPNKKNPETEVELGKLVRTPGLVARLMGLESMPVVAQERPRKATDSCCLNSESGSGQVPHRVDQDLCLEDVGSAKLEIRPQKLQKIGGFMERQPLDGGRAKPGVLGKKVLSAPSKNKFHKLASPVKSPRLPSGGHHRSRLIKAATKILEPGLQSKNRAKPAISYKDSSPVDAEGTGVDTTLKNSNEPFRDPVSGTSYGNLGGGTLRSKQREEEPLRQKIVSSAFGMSRASCSRTVLVESSSTSLAMQGEQNRNRKTSMQSNTKALAEMRNRGTNKIKPDGSATIFRRNQFRQNQSAMTRDKVPFGSKEDRKFGRVAAVMAVDNNQLSPISILEASFSNESCSFVSLNGNSGSKLQFGLTESCNTTRSSDLDTDLLDSASSVDIRRSDGSVDMSLESFLLDMLQAIVNALRMGPKSYPGYTGINETDQLRELLFDCMIECLDSNYSCLCKSGYMTYTKLTFLLTREKLMREVYQDIRGWMDLAGKFLDDMVKNEMKTSAGKWADCMMEAFEAGMEIESNILQTLVDETVIDFC